eukprot:gnl/TRDRNA2_/TRDRNA2_29396_c0_seq1.p1 gnl/TRDRNA2_/TRDRNA2_29396_c0~~gnl/TRDRNA2_/TRDRNA2_29396_c0_seq1.p1  ORF type:complete len:163 (-),score=33.68 gnl/TRDRNA2_/TRDRNA2_29396_c0_seq1:55-543(-)
MAAARAQTIVKQVLAEPVASVASFDQQALPASIAGVRTHLSIDQSLCGMPVELGEGTARVRLVAEQRMSADARGLVHGGFYFGMADYAAMLAINDPNVVLGAAETKFLKPVRVGDTLEAVATVQETKGKLRKVAVSVTREGEVVFTGAFTCFVLPVHVLGEQ